VTQACVERCGSTHPDIPLRKVDAHVSRPGN
jgi:hypothetical protein